MQNERMMHVGAELVVIGGVTFWLNSKITNLEQQLAVMQSTLKNYEAVINRQGAMIEDLLAKPDPTPAIMREPTRRAEPEVIRKPRKKNTRRIHPPSEEVVDNGEDILEAELRAIEAGRGGEEVELEFEG